MAFRTAREEKHLTDVIDRLRNDDCVSWVSERRRRGLYGTQQGWISGKGQGIVLLGFGMLHGKPSLSRNRTLSTNHVSCGEGLSRRGSMQIKDGRVTELYFEKNE